jgi:hypothetical protein
MPYQIDRYNNTPLVTVPDGTVDTTTTDIKFVGKNFAGYGEIQNENFLFLLENFAGANPPPKKLDGQIWYDSSSNKLKFYDGSKWRTTGGSEVSETQPTGLTSGDFWWDSANDQLYAYNGTDFILVGPQGAGTGITQMISRVIRDTNGVNHNVIVGSIDNSGVIVISGDEFNVDTDPSNITKEGVSINGFTKIKKGITLTNTDALTGVTAGAGNANIPIIWGTASNALRLGGFLADDFIQKSSPTFDTGASFGDTGIAIGDSSDLKISIENDNEGVFENSIASASTPNVFKIKTKNSSGALIHSTTFNSNGVLPATTGTFDLGSASLRYSTVYATTFNGVALQANELLVGATYRSASTSSANNSIAARTSTGNLVANVFEGIASSARYADLAENYITAEEHPAGTVMAVCEHGEHEACAASASSIVIGVISDKPAYLMNAETEGQAVGLKGRVPVRVTGPVRKGQAVYAWQDGVASTIATSGLVGVALETDLTESEKLVECVLKV